MVNIPVSKMVSLFETLVTNFSQLWVTLNTNLSDLPVVGDVGAEILTVLGINNITLLSFMLGGGIFVYLYYQLFVWLFNLIT